MASERYSFSLTTFSPRYFEMSNTFLWKGGIYFESVEIKTLKIVRHVYPTGDLVQIECSEKGMKP